MKNQNSQESQLLVNFDTVRAYLALLNQLGVLIVELRHFKSGKYQKFSTDNTGIDSVIRWIIDSNLSSETINCSFNLLKEEAILSSTAIKDTDIQSYRFIMLDFDSVRPKGKSSNDSEYQAAIDDARNVAVHLNEVGFKSMFLFGSGNGAHLFILLGENHADDIKETVKSFTQIISNRFSTDQVEIDTVVANPARFGKLIGTPSTKGENTADRPHRISCFLNMPSSNKVMEVTSVETLIRYVEDNKKDLLVKQQVEGSFSPSKTFCNDFVYVDVAAWLSYYKLDYYTKPGDYPGVLLYILRECPFGKHSHNQNGVSISESESGRARFRCLHASDENKTIYDLQELYPIPESARIENNKKWELPDIESLENGQNYYFDDFTMDNNFIYKTINNKKTIIANTMFICVVRMDAKTALTKYLLRYKSNGEWHEKLIDAEFLQITSFRKLSRYNVIFNPGHEGNVVEFLNLMKAGIPIIKTYEENGWIQDGDDLFFRTNQIYSEKGARDCPVPEVNVMSFERAGTFEEYSDFVKKRLIGTNLELAICIALGTIVGGFLKISGIVSIVNFIVNFCGLTSTGKSTILLIIASMVGNPDFNMRTMNATSAAIIKLASNNHGVPLILDELGAKFDKNISNTIYALGMGEERLRMSKDRSLVPQERFEVITCLSSEERLKTYLQNIGGLEARYLEFENIELTKSATEAEEIKSFISTHYGTVYDEILKKVFEVGPEVITDYFNQSRNVLLDKMKEDHLKHRISGNLAILRAGAMLGSELLDWQMSFDKIDNLLIGAYEQKFNDDDLDINQFEAICQHIAANAHKFIVNGSRQRFSNGMIGKATIDSDGIKVNVFTVYFHNLIKKMFNVNDPNEIIHKLLSEGNLASEKDRNTKRVHINKVKYSTYELLLPTAYKPFFGIIEGGDNSKLYEEGVRKYPEATGFFTDVESSEVIIQESLTNFFNEE